MNKVSLNIGRVSALLVVAMAQPGYAQSSVPDNVMSVVNTNLEDGQKMLQDNGYEIADSSLFSAKQLWWNEASKSCVEIKFDKKGDKRITSAAPGNEKKCIDGAAASRKVWNTYHDGQAPAKAAALDAERSKLASAGYVASYWIDDAAPGRDSEIWSNESSNQCMRITWNASDQQNIKTMECKPEQSKNPAPH